MEQGGEPERITRPSFGERLLGWSEHQRHPATIVTVVAIVIAVCITLNIWLDSLLGVVFPFLLSLFGVMVAALVGGMWAGLLATLLFMLAVNFFLLEPYFAFRMREAQDVVPLIVFAVQGILVSVFIERMQRAQRQSEAAMRATQRAMTQREEAQRHLQATQAALRESEERFLSSYAAVGQFAVTPQGHFLKANRAFSELLGYDQAFFSETELLMLAHPDDREALAGAINDLAWGDTPFVNMEVRFITAAQTPVTTLVSLSAIRDMLGTPQHIVSLVQDITERREAEEGLRNFAEQLEQSNRELEQFAYVASHDLQEPLRVVAGYLQLIERRYRGKLDSDADEFIAFAVDAAKRMQGLINDLLAYSRVGRHGKAFEVLPLEPLLQQALANLQVTIAEHNATVTHDPLPALRVDGTQMVQLFQNLIGNGIKFHGEAPPIIHVGARRTERGWTFAVSDNGIGIEPHYRERIFLIFQRLHTREAYPGTGIGLAICQKIVERLGGRIWVESSPGAGATFFFTIPDAGRGGREWASSLPGNQ